MPDAIFAGRSPKCFAPTRITDNVGLNPTGAEHDPQKATQAVSDYAVDLIYN